MQAPRDQHNVETIARARVGQAIGGGKFRLQRLLGVGGTAAVYEATHRNGKRVALKLLHPAMCASDSQRKRLLREAYVANAIGHRGIVQIFDDGVDDTGAAYLVMELLEGETAAALQARCGGKIPVPQLLAIADAVLDALAAAHARGVIHRDIKPHNLFMGLDGRVWILDFGIAHLFEQIPGATLDTQLGSTLGTPAFMAQEQARGRWNEVDRRSDVWAVGATLFTLASGEYVHAGETINEQLGRAMTLPARSLASVAPELPAAFVSVVDRALCFDPAVRWPDARAMQLALRAVSAASLPIATVAAPNAQLAQLDAGQAALLMNRASSPSSALTRSRMHWSTWLRPLALLVAAAAIGASAFAFRHVFASIDEAISVPTALSQPRTAHPDNSQSTAAMPADRPRSEPALATTVDAPDSLRTSAPSTFKPAVPPVLQDVKRIDRERAVSHRHDPLDLRY